MIAKLSVWGRNREEAIARGRTALSDMHLTGIKTNIPVHLQILRNGKFLNGNYTTRLIGEDFKYKEAGPGNENRTLNILAVAVSAFNREFKTVPKEEPGNWKRRARAEAVRQ
jgi:acetyl-CoA carboxylase biotin carboxylase subunit